MITQEKIQVQQNITKFGKEETNKDPWGLTDAMKSTLSEYRVAFTYDPYYNHELENNILNVEFTSKACYILIKNGTLIKISNDDKANKKVHEKSIEDSIIPTPVYVPTKVINIACGKSHCLAKGTNGRIYSWGYNNYGQLGLNRPMDDSEKIEPGVIEDFKFVKISQIYARVNTSYAISEDKEFYAWGSNEKGQIDFNNREKRLPRPKLINFTKQIAKNIIVLLDKKESKSLLAELNIPFNSIDKSLETLANTNFLSKEYSMKEELKKLQTELNFLRKIPRTLEELSEFDNDVQNLIIKYQEKINILEKQNKIQYVINNPVIIHEKQIEYIKKKQSEMIADLQEKKYFLDERSLVKWNEQKYEKENNLGVLSGLKDVDAKFKNFRNNVVELVSKVNSELQIQKFSKLESFHKGYDEEKSKLKKGKKLQEYISLFSLVQGEIRSKMNHIHNKEFQQEADNIKNKLEQEFPNFSCNMLSELTQSNREESVSLMSNIDISNSNLEKLDEKIRNLELKKNDISHDLIDAFDKNITLARQNNNLILLTLQLANKSYNTMFDKIIYNENPHEFNQIKEEIEKIKFPKRSQSIFEPGTNNKLNERAFTKYPNDSISDLHSDDDLN